MAVKKFKDSEGRSFAVFCVCGHQTVLLIASLLIIKNLFMVVHGSARYTINLLSLSCKFARP